jgi:hypothetical protein
LRHAAPKDSSFMRPKVEGIGKALQAGCVRPDPGKAHLVSTRNEVLRQWPASAELLRRQGDDALAAQVEWFVRTMPPVRTDLEQIAAGLPEHMAARRRAAAYAGKDQGPKRGR